MFFLLLFLLPIALLLIGLADLPGGYYTLLRIVVSITGAIVCAAEYKAKEKVNLWVILYAALVILFNPIIPIYLYDKDIWIPIDIISQYLFLPNILILRYRENFDMTEYNPLDFNDSDEFVYEKNNLSFHLYGNRHCNNVSTNSLFCKCECLQSNH